MKQRIMVCLFSLLFMQSALADSAQYIMRVDGLACPFCAYGIEKKLKSIEGVQEVDVNLEQGLVTVNVVEGTSLSEEQMKRLFKDAGFTYRSMKETRP